MIVLFRPSESNGETVKKKDMIILTKLRQDARQSLVNISRQTNIPVSTVYEKIKQNKAIKKFTSILDFPALGFNIRAKVLVKGDDKLKDFLLSSENVNSVFQLNDRFDFMVDCIFRYMHEMQGFMQELDKLSEKKEVYYVTKELKREEFFNSVEYLNKIQEVD